MPSKLKQSLWLHVTLPQTTAAVSSYLSCSWLNWYMCIIDSTKVIWIHRSQLNSYKTLSRCVLRLVLSIYAHTTVTVRQHIHSSGSPSSHRAATLRWVGNRALGHRTDEANGSRIGIWA